MLVHTIFDVLAWAVAAMAGSMATRRWGNGRGFGLTSRPWYFACAAVGALGGAVLLGSANTLLAGLAEGKSVLGGLLGGILGVEVYKLATGLRGSTGFGFVVPMATGIVIGRVGCFLAGLADFTYGVATRVPWGWDFGDGIARHPVQLYESAAMLVFLAWFVRALARGDAVARRHGFALFAVWYGTQRFAWEFLKPYPPLLGPLNVFHFGCLALAAYGAAAIVMREKQHAPA